MEKKRFYDIHCHAFNLSHPNLLAFFRRYQVSKSLTLLIYYTLGPVLPIYLAKKLKETQYVQRFKNILSVMENDIAGQFLLMEECIKENEKRLFKDGKLRISGIQYHRMVLTPLMIDFGYKNMLDPDIHYKNLSEKPIIEQVVDIFNGIKRYQKERNGCGLFEIYPFLGLNTGNYSLKKVEKMLDKYFSDYRGIPEDFQARLGRFSGDIEDLNSNYFAGIKVYPPLGFDPWPEKGEERKKVECLYEYCAHKQIPITTHACEEGFVVIPKADVPRFLSPDKWKNVIKAYPSLKLNLAHFGSEKDRTPSYLELALSGENVYLDFSYIAYEDAYYAQLKNIIANLTPGDQEKLKDRLLYGSDFMMNLLRVHSYSEFLQIFDRTQHFSPEDKDRFGSKNPERFLFNPPLSVHTEDYLCVGPHIENHRY